MSIKSNKKEERLTIAGVAIHIFPEAARGSLIFQAHALN